MGVAYSADGKRLASVDQDGGIKLWDVTNNEILWDSDAEDVSYCLAFSPDGEWLATSVGIFESEHGRPVLEYKSSRFRDLGLRPSNVYSLAFSPDSQRLVYVTTSGRIVILKTGTWEAVDILERQGMSLISVG
jgi:WD40 repeat protein